MVLKGERIELGNCGLIAGAFSSTSGKADITLTTNGDVLYYNSGRQRLAIGDEGTVLTVSDADLPAWEAASAGVSLSGNNTWTGTNAFQDEVSVSSGNCFTTQLASVTISSGQITGTTNVMVVDTEASASSDDLDAADFTAAAVTGSIFTLKAANDGRTVVVKDTTTGTGVFLGAGDFSLDNGQDVIMFAAFYNLTNNYEISRSNNL